MQIPGARLCSIPWKSLKLRAALQSVSIDREFLILDILKTRHSTLNKKNYQEIIFENKREKFCVSKSRLILYLILSMRKCYERENYQIK